MLTLSSICLLIHMLARLLAGDIRCPFTHFCSESSLGVFIHPSIHAVTHALVHLLLFLLAMPYGPLEWRQPSNNESIAGLQTGLST